MPKGSKQKLKLYYLSRILLEKTDDDHSLTMPEIQRCLKAYDVTADRKSLYDDMDALEVLGIDVIGAKDGRSYNYHVGKKQFDIAELKLLVDAIQSSKFITEKKSNELIKKVTSFASQYEAEQLKRQVVVQGRIKTMNESIYYIVDDIHYAISHNRKIRFEYYKWNVEKKLEKRKDKIYEVSPWALMWDDENYYLVAYDSEEDIVKHYRVDKMQNIGVSGERREGRELFRKLDVASYTRKNFNMVGGEETTVKLEFENGLVGVMIDRFGKDIPIRPAKEEGWSVTNVSVAISDQFFGWVFSFGKWMKIVSPENVVDSFRNELESLREEYIK
ncbi:MAG: WYL domain-containing protein [Lachnospiraceae bacterium]|nr:WYL domain-containing protein [Lachnospiraceae bacterium]